MLTATHLFGALFVLQVPEGGSPWMYLLLASGVCAGAFALSARTRMERRNNN
jgi:hypothetical protein